ncbi:MAG: DUF1570 domain-containing protein [Planctomycetes bacterium]|nr:DUF1570 domain-containing protein [Planctomycetota bacterium]
MLLRSLALLAACSAPSSEPVAAPVLAFVLAPALLDLDAEIARVQELRALDPDDPVTLERLGTLLGKGGDQDGELAYSMLALAGYDDLEFDDPKQKEAKLAELGARIAKLDPASGALKASRDQYLKDLTWALDLYAKNKKSRNALDVAGRILAYRPGHKLARETVSSILAKLDDDGKAEAERLLGRSELRRPRAFLQEWRKKHTAWKDAGKASSKGYVVASNIGYDVLQLAARALEDLSLHYRRAYAADPSMQFGKTDVQLFRTRAEFADAFPEAKDTPGLKGLLWTRPGEGGDGKKPSFRFALLAYDPRDEGRPLSFLFETLAHEASHQYMRLSIGTGDAPHWLDEGMASFYEGARIDEDGSVHVGLPAWERLRVLALLLKADPKILRATIEAPSDKFLTGEQYSVAWGLVYWLDQFQREDGTRPHRASLKRAIEVVRSGTATSGWTVFQRAVLEPAKLPFEAFEDQWTKDMLALADLESDPDRARDHYLERAQASAAKGRADAAREDFERVLAYTDEHPAALLGLAKLTDLVSEKSKKLEDKDATLLWARRAHRSAMRAGDEELAKAAALVARRADPGGFDKIAAGELRYRKSVEAEIAKHLGASRPKTALALARRWLDAVLEEDRADALVRELREQRTLALERPYLPFDGKTFDGLTCEPGTFVIEDGEIACTIQRGPNGETDLGSLFVESPLAPRFRLEGELRVDTADAVAIFGVELPWRHAVKGIAMRVRPGPGSQASGRDFPPFHELAPGVLAPIDQVTDANGYSTWMFMGTRRSEVELTSGTWVRFTLTRAPNDELHLALDGEEVSVRQIDDEEKGVRAGLVVYGGAARVRNLRVVELDRL